MRLVGTWHVNSSGNNQYGANFDYSNSSTATATYTFTGLLAGAARRGGRDVVQRRERRDRDPADGL